MPLFPTRMPKIFWEGFKKGARETPRGLFAPLIMPVRFMVWVTDSVMDKSGQDKNKTT